MGRIKNSVQRWVEKIPFPFLVPFIFAIYYFFVLLMVLFLPLALLQEVILRLIAYRKSLKNGKDVVVVSRGIQTSDQYMELILPIVSNRAYYLNYAERKAWAYWNIAARLYESYGHRTNLEHINQEYLPTVILLDGYKKPKKFYFGPSADPGTELKKLCDELVPPSPKTDNR